MAEVFVHSEKGKKGARFGVRITGWAEIDKTLAQLPIEMRGPKLEAAMRKALNKIKTRARQLVPKPGYPGDKPDKKPLRDTIGVTLRRYKGGAMIAGYVGPEYPAGAHGHLIERGTSPHRIPKAGLSKKTLAGLGRDGKIHFFGRVVQHPGSDPKPFMEPAARDVAPNVETIIIEALNAAADKVRNDSSMWQRNNA